MKNSPCILRYLQYPTPINSKRISTMTITKTTTVASPIVYKAVSAIKTVKSHDVILRLKVQQYRTDLVTFQKGSSNVRNTLLNFRLEGGNYALLVRRMKRRLLSVQNLIGFTMAEWMFVVIHSQMMTLPTVRKLTSHCTI